MCRLKKLTRLAKLTSSNDDKRLQTFDRIISHPYGTSIWKVVSATELLSYLNIKLLILINILIKINITSSEMVIYSRSSIQNINNRRFWIMRNKCIIKFKKTINQILRKYNCVQKIHMNQNIELTNVKK